MTKKLTIKEIRIKLHKFENDLRKHRGSNKLVDKYLSKITYMQMWMRLIPIKKNELKGWSMPDYNDVIKFREIGSGLLEGENGNKVYKSKTTYLVCNNCGKRINAMQPYNCCSNKCADAYYKKCKEAGKWL